MSGFNVPLAVLPPALFPFPRFSTRKFHHFIRSQTWRAPRSENVANSLISGNFQWGRTACSGSERACAVDGTDIASLLINLNGIIHEEQTSCDCLYAVRAACFAGLPRPERQRPGASPCRQRRCFTCGGPRRDCGNRTRPSQSILCRLPQREDEESRSAFWPGDNPRQSRCDAH